jgi:hypothetical protein
MTTSKRVTRTSHWHFKVEIKNPDGSTETKYYFTKKDIRAEHGISSMSIHRAITNPNHKPRKKYEHLKFTKIYEPARLIVPLKTPLESTE